MSAVDLPDPLGFTVRALTERGALVERADALAVALLPPALAAELALPEEITVSSQVADGVGAVTCGIGSPLLERLTGDVRRATPRVAIAPTVDAPKVTHATSLAAKLVVRNAVADVLDASAGEAVYARVTVAWAVEADDRYEGVVHVTVGAGGEEPDARAQALLDVSAHEGPLIAAEVDEPSLRSALERLPGRVAGALEAAVEDALSSIERRHARDHARMTEYFAGLLAELGAGRRKVDPATLATRAKAIESERDARLRDLALRYAAKVTAAPVALVCATLPVVRVRLRARRRKLERELRVALPGGASALDAMACDGCGGVTSRPALCDDRLHVMCERCVPQAQGRFECGACERASRAKRG